MRAEALAAQHNQSKDEPLDGVTWNMDSCLLLDGVTWKLEIMHWTMILRKEGQDAHARCVR